VQGLDVRFIGLYQDPRMAGESYWQELLGLTCSLPASEVSPSRSRKGLLGPQQQ